MKLFLEKAVIFQRLSILAIFLLALPAHPVLADDVAKIKVMTQNQYLGADLSPLIAAGDDLALFNQALVDVLEAIGASNYPERVESLARTIAKGGSDLIGLQEIWAFGCTPAPFASVPDPCGYFGPAFNDHLEATVDALLDIGADYYVAARSQNLTVEPVLFPGFPAGIPVDINTDGSPDILVTVKDRDAILARSNIVATPFTYPCTKPSLDGCNFEFVASLPDLVIGGSTIEINIERGFVAVDAVVRGDAFRFVNTHLEVRFPSPVNNLSRIFQSVQASELIGTLAAFPPPPGTRLIVVGDINSDPDDPYPAPGFGDFLTPYQQFVLGLSYQGVPISEPYVDTWTLNRKPSPGLTCCEAADLLNPVSIHDRRVDMIFSLDVPDKVKAETRNTRPKDKTLSGLWPSDHATVAAKLKFKGDDEDDDDDDD